MEKKGRELLQSFRKDETEKYREHENERTENKLQIYSSLSFSEKRLYGSHCHPSSCIHLRVMHNLFGKSKCPKEIIQYPQMNTRQLRCTASPSTPLRNQPSEVHQFLKSSFYFLIYRISNINFFITKVYHYLYQAGKNYNNIQTGRQTNHNERI